MGPWRTVWLAGTVEPLDLRVLQEWAPMINGRTDWLAETMDVRGIFQGDLDELADALNWAVAAAPSLRAAVHVSPPCAHHVVETTIIIAMGTVTTGSAVIDSLRTETESEAADRASIDWELEGGAMRWRP